MSRVRAMPGHVLLAVLVWLLALGSLFAPARGARAAVDGALRDIAPYVSYMVDDAGRLNIDQVPAHASAMKPLTEPELRAGYSRSAYWFRLTPPPGAWLLEVESPFLDHVDLYLPKAGGGYTVVRSGDALPYSSREIPFRHPLFSLPADLAGPAYLHVSSEGLVRIPLRLWQPETFASRMPQQELGFGVYYGIMIVMVLYNFSLFLFVRDRNYLYYVLYIGIYILFQASFNGYAPMYLWPNSPWWAGHAPGFFVAAVVLGALQFSRHFLDAERNVPGFARAMRVLEVVTIADLVLVLAGPYALAAKIGNYLGMSIVFIVVPAGILCLKRGYRPARWFITAWTAFLLGVFTSGLDLAGYLPYWPYWIYAMQIGSATEVVLLSIALADRIAVLRREKDEARAQADLHLYRLNNELEALVQQRTAELEQAKVKAETLSRQLAAHNSALEQVATHDGLTGAFNRGAFTELAQQRIVEASRHGTAYALLMIDLDYFKTVNDCFGHQSGDRVLREVANVLDRGKRSSDLLGRYGGEEFVLFLCYCDRDTALGVAERLRRSVAEVRLADLPELHLTSSFGLAWPVPGDADESLDALIKRADQALYLAKHLGRDRVCSQADVARRLEAEVIA